ncbi:Na+/H+ antiporter NhaA [Compostimonas suwonensis]|uniref:Na(+)/H(+) antiporter NhaA n=1 Tax=Compostimonas suwonensis TaxID=1048394 RepID=A0A2M9BW45_9MICO|nr:Na+/H+ antiporter NhaA [Compostimonas suwonensis]PJJ62160.1 NhaA family Na+:H+ antiporter [Compostimonas suwonensis]
MSFVRSERYAAGILMFAAALGLLLANTAIGPELIAFSATRVGLPAIGLDLSVGHWISDGLLAVFFFIVAVELKRELAIGELDSAKKALLPAIAAVGGVVVPALIYLAIAASSGLAVGWPIPTATDIAFALGVLAVVGRSLPTRVRVFLLALAVLDDLVAILIIAFFFTTDANLAFVGLAALTAIAFGLLSRLLAPRSRWVLARRPAWPIVTAMIVLGVATWYLTSLSGVHATIAGVALGLLAARRPGGRAAHVLEPYSNTIVLPLFAFSAAMVAIPAVRVSELSPAFWAILVALPIGKIVGITLAGGLAIRLTARGSKPVLSMPDLFAVSALGGIGFTVALLMNELAFEALPEVADEGTLAVILGSCAAIAISSVVVGLRSRHYRRAGHAS